MRFHFALTLMLVCLIVLACGIWTLNNALAREYLWWMTGAFRVQPTDDYSNGPPLPLVMQASVKTMQ